MSEQEHQSQAPQKPPRVSGAKAEGVNQPAQQTAAQSAPLPEPRVGEKWGEFPPVERQAELKRILEAWEQEQDHGDRPGPLAKFKLTGADVYWLASYVAGAGDVDVGRATLADPPMGFRLNNLHLEGTNLDKAQLQHANLIDAQLQHANLQGTHLQHAYLPGARLQDANLNVAELQEAFLGVALFQRANLQGARLQDAYLYQAELQGADLRWAQLRGAELSTADLRGCDLREARLDGDTILIKAIFDEHVKLADVRWEGASLLQVNWDQVPHLGDEAEARQTTTKVLSTQKQWPKRPEERLEEYQTAQRAYRQLAVVLREQGLIEPADRFTYRAQIMQRKALWWQLRSRKLSKLGSYLFSLFLAVLTGYGFRMWRIIFAYALLILAFASGYWVLDRQARDPLNFGQALIVSITAFHGRVFSYNPFTLSDPQIVVTAIEAICGLVIEGLFVAMLVQRFFSR